MYRRVVLVLVMLCLSLMMASCDASMVRTRKVLPEWSRGLQVGVAALNQPVDLLVSHGHVHMVWVAVGGKQLHYARLDDTGQVQVNMDLEITGAHASDARLALNGDGSFSVLWTDNPGIPRALFMGHFSHDGQLLFGPVRLSPPEARVSDYAITPRKQGGYDIFWTDEIASDGGIHHLHIAGDGRTVSADRLLIPQAMNPSLQVDPYGVVHLAWVEQPSMRENYVYYATFDSASGVLSEPIRVAYYRTATGLISYPPVLGLDQTRAYLFWALEQRGGGMTPGESETHFVSFRLSDPQPSEPTILHLPGTARPTYARASGSLPYERLAAPDNAWPSSVLYMPATLNGQQREAGVFLIVEVATRHRTSREVVWAIFVDGSCRGYQLLTAAGNAMRPAAFLDDQGSIHLAWLSAGGFGRYNVYYASTSASVRARLDQVTLQDRATDLLNAIWSLAPALGFFPPVFLLWTFASFIWIVLFYIVKVEGGLERRPSQFALVVAVLLYLASKLFLLPGVLLYAPFLDRFPASLQAVPVLGTPLFTLLVALGAVYIYFRRQQYRSLLAAYLIFVVTDSLLSLFIYVPGWLAG